jgi:hypothetical protein
MLDIFFQLHTNDMTEVEDILNISLSALFTVVGHRKGPLRRTVDSLPDRVNHSLDPQFFYQGSLNLPISLFFIPN